MIAAFKYELFALVLWLAMWLAMGTMLTSYSMRGWQWETAVTERGE